MSAPTRKFSTAGSPQLPPTTSVTEVMLEVLLALVPGIGAYVFFFGPAILVQMALAIAAALIFEVIALRLRGRDIGRFVLDFSAVLTAVLYVLCLPPLMPWWGAIVGMFFAIIVAKHLYGGLGHNVFNPAMVAYVVMIIAFPRQATDWTPPTALAHPALSFSAQWIRIFTGNLPVGLQWDAVSQATALDTIKTLSGKLYTLEEIRRNPVFSGLSAYGWYWIAAAYLLGGVWLAGRRIIPWQIPAAMLGSTLLITTPFNWMDPSIHPSPLFHIFSGGMMLGAFFIATDPVTGASTPRGRVVFAFGVAVLTLVIRRWGGYPDGVAFAVLLMNLSVPLIDRFTVPRVYGHRDPP